MVGDEEDGHERKRVEEVELAIGRRSDGERSVFRGLRDGVQHAVRGGLEHATLVSSPHRAANIELGSHGSTEVYTYLDASF